jgi:hemin uptake protein HemP
MTSRRVRSGYREAIPERERTRLLEGARPIHRYRTEELIGDCPWIVIEHGSEEYRLRVTRLGKLILTK